MSESPIDLCNYKAVSTSEVSIGISKDESIGSYFNSDNEKNIDLSVDATTNIDGKSSSKIGVLSEAKKFVKSLCGDSFKYGSLARRIKIHVLIFCERKITLNVDITDTISDVKKQICELDKLRTEKEYLNNLFFGRQELEDSHTLMDYNIKNKSTLHFIHPVLNISSARCLVIYSINLKPFVVGLFGEMETGLHIKQRIGLAIGKPASKLRLAFKFDDENILRPMRYNCQIYDDDIPWNMTYGCSDVYLIIHI
jgi:hypothetical protein